MIAPANAQFNKKFGAHETMAHDSATFNKMREQIMIIWINMNSTWNPRDFNNLYNTWWYEDQSYENSLQATNDYFEGLVSRIDATIMELEHWNYSQSHLQPYNAYYQSQLDAFRNETFDAGGLLWAIRGCWYLSFQPAAYYFLFWYLPLLAGLVIAAIILIATSVDW